MQVINEQVKLPWHVAFEVVWQGIRIRLGRSLVTLSGVALGTAFLMSLLTASALRHAVKDEAAMREEVSRMQNFLRGEAGRLEGRTIGVAALGPASEIERRLLQSLAEGSRVEDFSPNSRPDVILVTGEAAGASVQFPSNILVALSREEQSLHLQPRRSVQLDRKKRPEELDREAAEARTARVRSIWIVAIALMVTVIGICNALLMSVTERFREIGTMKCLGALSSFIRRIFFIESGLLGFAGSLAGALGGILFSTFLYAMTFGFGLVLGSLPWASLAGSFLLCWLAGVILSILAAIYPAHHAASMVPAAALRSNV